MPFGPFNTRHRLGIAKLYLPNAFRWAREILRLPSDTFNATIPVYQHQLVHSRDTGFGEATAPTASEKSPAVNGIFDLGDEDVDAFNIIRQVSMHDAVHSARNTIPITSPPYPLPITPNGQFTLQTYATARYNKVFMVNNEPEDYLHEKTIISNNPQNAVNDIDNFSNIATPTFRTAFWQFLPLVTVTPPPPQQPYSYYPRRVTPEAIGYVFLQLKRIFGNSRGHVVLPPCPAGAIAGYLNPPTGPQYWPTFYDSIHPVSGQASTISVGGQPAETKISPSTLSALHLHYYSPPRGTPNWPVNLPLATVAEGMFYLRKSVDWYRDRYIGLNQNLPLDVLLSEFGMLWNILAGDTPPGYSPRHKWVWGGGWDNFRDGLSWWNSWLCWVMRRAPIEFKLSGSTQGNYTDSRAVYASILEPHQVPYTTFATEEGNLWNVGLGNHNQLFFNCDTGAYAVKYNAEFINVTNMLISGRFSSSFSSFPVTSWNDGFNKPLSNLNFRLGPLGACYKVWAEVGADAVTGDLATGWTNTTQANQGGTVSLNLQAGYSTVYIPIIKSQIGGYPAGTRFDVKWGSQEVPFGYGEMSEFPDSQTITTIYDSANNATTPPQLVQRNLLPADYQSVYSTMVFPVVCYTTAPRNITLKVVRSNGSGSSTGPSFAIGRPIVINRGCSWLTNQ